MKKGIIWAIVAVIIIALVGVGVYFSNQDDGNQGIKLETAKDMKNFFGKIYKKIEDQLPEVGTDIIDVSDAMEVTNYTGLKSNKDVEAIVVSMPVMSAQAYEAVMVKVKNGADIESMKQEMLDNIDMNTIKNISSIMGNMNNSKNDPRANLLASLKPYLRDSKKGQLDNYMNLLNVAKIAEIMKDNNKGE